MNRAEAIGYAWPEVPQKKDTRPSYSQMHPGYAARKAADYRIRHPRSSEDTQWASFCQILKLHDITLDQYHALNEHQDFLCACCALEPPITKFQTRGHVIDHDHKTGLIRALLCAGCNFAIGQLQESPARAYAVARYLEKHGSRDSK